MTDDNASTYTEPPDDEPIDIVAAFREAKELLGPIPPDEGILVTSFVPRHAELVPDPDNEGQQKPFGIVKIDLRITNMGGFGGYKLSPPYPCDVLTLIHPEDTEEILGAVYEDRAYLSLDAYFWLKRWQDSHYQ